LQQHRQKGVGDRVRPLLVPGPQVAQHSVQ
jgi:hypothetical protein